jgi:hypothetical protein
MSKTRNNHYVQQWYQEGFFEIGRNTLAYLDMKPPQRVLEGGRLITERALFEAPTSRAFQQRDLYSTFFGTSVNDEIERHLFGDIDRRGPNAIRAFAGSDVGEWHRHFQTLFEYIDIQKIRTPKGLDWLRTQYPTLTQNELMFEMQGIRMMHCTIWTEGVREIVSAEDADVKFIISDHPVTIYNHAAPPEVQACAYPNDPTIALKASQTIFPLTRNFCLILTNLEYAQDPSTSPLDKRTFARNYRRSMVRTDAFIRTRRLSSQEVARINYVLKARARRYIAAGRKEWLYPEKSVSEPWAELRKTLLRSQLLKASPGLDELGLEDALRDIEQLKERDPLAVLQEDSLAGGEKGGQLNLSKLAPNFEITMYLAQATGSCIVTDSFFRWKEVKRAIRQRARGPYAGLATLARNIERSEFAFPQSVTDIVTFAFDKTFAAYPALIRDIFKYLSKLSDRGPKPNREAQLAGRFAKAHAPVQTAIRKARIPAKKARISCASPSGGIQDNTVNRLLLMSSSEKHLPGVPMAFFIEERLAD